MNSRYGVSIIAIIALSMFAMGCSDPSSNCPQRQYVDISGVDNFETRNELPFRFPLDNISGLMSPFAVSGYTTSSLNFKEFEYHAAEDYDQEPGTPIYAMASGVVSFSGTMGGYGWLVIVDHPDMNIYSLYGHLSPSRWHINSGTPVKKGELIAYLGDADENGGSAENPLTPHLHFGIRTGQRADYPSMGEWRWQAGWIKYCPQHLGWLQPSLVITNQEIPPGGFSKPSAGFFAIWGLEASISAVMLTGALSLFMVYTRKRKRLFLLFYSAFLAAAVWISFFKEFVIGYGLLTLLLLLLISEGYRLIRRSRKN